MKVSFFQRGNTIQARVSHKSSCIRISTGIKVELHHRFDKTFIGNNLEVMTLNNELKRQEIMLNDLFIRYNDLELVRKNFRNTPELPESQDSYDLAELSRKFVQLCANGKKSVKNRPYSPESIRTYANVANYLYEFAHECRRMDISKFHIDAQLGPLEKRSIADAFDLYFFEFDEWMVRRDMSIYSRGVIMNIVGAFVKYWAEYYFFNLPKVKRLEKVEHPIVVLHPEFVSKFLSDNLYDRLGAEMKVVWEVAATILVSTLRLSDAVSLKPTDFMIRHDGMFLNKAIQKTVGENCQLLIPKKLASIYQHNMSTRGSVYSGPIKMFDIHHKMRPLFRMYDELHLPHSVNRLGNRGQVETISKPMWDWVHPHMLRKSAITTLKYYGMDDSHIKHASGHAKNSNAYNRYTAVVDTMFSRDFKNVHERMGI